MHVIYLKNNHLYRNTSLAIKAILISISCFMVSYIVNTILLPIRCNNWVEWIISGARTLTTSLIGSIIIELVFNRENFEWLLVRCFRKNRK